MNPLSVSLSKRSFLGWLGALPVGLAAMKLVSGGGIAPAMAAEAEKVSGPFTLPKLPYAYNALSSAIDAKTMEIHHSKHHQAYIDKLNEEVSKDARLKGKSLEDIMKNVSKYATAVRNNAGGHWNHSFFWENMSPTASEPSPELMKAIEDTYGTFDNFKKEFEEAGTKQFGSGWVWLIVTSELTVEIQTTPNQDNPLMDVAELGGDPILGNDVWEHAYYLKYQNKRADYLKSWWKVVNWAKVSERFSALKAV